MLIKLNIGTVVWVFIYTSDIFFFSLAFDFLAIKVLAIISLLFYVYEIDFRFH